MSFFHTAFLFWMILDPLGNIPFFLGVLKPYEPKEQRRIIIREMCIALVLMVIFLFFGQGFFQLLRVDQASLQIAGGIILFLIAIEMVFASPGGEKEKRLAREPLIVPLATPAVAGPAILATLTLYGGGLEPGRGMVLLALFVAWLCLLPVLLSASYLKRLLGKNGIVAMERLFGYIVILISCQMTLSGLLAAFGK